MIVLTVLEASVETKREAPLCLHIGAGETILPEFINLDIREKDGMDKISLVYPLDFDDEVFDLVYSSHVLEHFPRKQTRNILQEWTRVLKPSGTLRLSVPSFEAIIEIYSKFSDLEQVIGPLYGGQDYRFNYHFTVFDKKTLTSLMESVNLEAVHAWDPKRTIHSKCWDYSQAETKGMLISLNLEGRKKGLGGI